MLWYLADGSLNDYLKSQVVLQGQYYSGQQTNVAQANFTSNTGLLTFEQLTLANTKSAQKENAIIIDQVVVQLAPEPTPSLAQKNNNDISKTVQHITIEKVTINKLRFNLTQQLNELSNLTDLQQQISQKLAADYPALYPNIAAKYYAEKHPELNIALANTSPENSTKKAVIETNQAVIESKAAKQKKRILGKATTRIIILSFTINSLEINSIARDGSKLIQKFSNVKLPIMGQEHGLASNQVGGEILRQLLQKIKQLKQNK